MDETGSGLYRRLVCLAGPETHCVDGSGANTGKRLVVGKIMQRHSRICVSVLWAVPALAGVVSLAGCVSARAKVAELTVEPHVVESVERFKKEYVLAPGDQIEITVRRVPELSRTQIIRPDGNITLPVVNQLKAAGLTAVELNTKLEELFAA